MIATFYRPRWASWFAEVDAAMANRTAFNQTRFVEQIEAWEAGWTRTTGAALPTQPAGGALQRAREVHERHFGGRLSL